MPAGGTDGNTSVLVTVGSDIMARLIVSIFSCFVAGIGFAIVKQVIQSHEMQVIEIGWGIITAVIFPLVVLAGLALGFGQVGKSKAERLVAGP